MYLFWGKVKEGRKRGKKLGYPTANITLHKKIPEGIYISEIMIEENKYPAATFIGKAEMFGEKEKKAEVYILDFNKNLYGKWVTVYIFKKIRDNKKFPSSNELIKQIKKDVAQTRKYFVSSKNSQF